MNYQIVSDSSANLLPQSGRLAIAPLKIMVSGREFVDDDTLDVNEMIDVLRYTQGKSTTACPSIADWLSAFGNAEFVFCFTITSRLSGSANAARLAREEYRVTHPGRKVYLFDTLSTGPEMRLLIERTVALLECGVSPEDTASLIRSYMRRTKLIFSLKSLKNLANNGRVSPIIAKLASALGVSLIGRASQKGELAQLSKCRGERRTLEKIVLHMKELGYTGGRVVIDHCRNEEGASQLAALLHTAFPAASVHIGQTRGLCSFYAESGGLMIGFEGGEE